MPAIDTLLARKGVLERMIQDVDKTIASAESERAIRAAELMGLSFAIGVIEAECAPAHKDVSRETPRPKRRNIRAMVLDFLTEARGSVTAETVAQSLSIRQRAAESAIAHWNAKGRVGIEGGFAQIHHSPPKGVSALAGNGGVDVAAERERFLALFEDGDLVVTMADAIAHDIHAETVLRAEHDGLISAAPMQGGYMLVSSEARAA